MELMIETLMNEILGRKPSFGPNNTLEQIYNSIDEYQLLEEIKTTCNIKGLTTNNDYIHSVMQLYKIIDRRYGTIIIGNSCSGKSVMLNVLYESINRLNKIHDEKKKELNNV